MSKSLKNTLLLLALIIYVQSDEASVRECINKISKASV